MYFNRKNNIHNLINKILTLFLLGIIVFLPINSAFATYAPNCDNAYPSRHILWPPNHKLKKIEIRGVHNSNIVIKCIKQDEPLNSNGDGNTDIDGFGIGSSKAKVRAERQGGGNGRIYHIGFQATNQYGQCIGTVKVGVPQNKKKSIIDDGPLYDSSPDNVNCDGQAENLPPEINSNPINQVRIGENYVYDVDATDPEDDSLSYALTSSPNGMTIDSMSGVIQWAPGSAGDFEVAIFVADDKGNSTTQNFVLSVLEPINQAPVITSAPILQAPVNSEYSYQAIASDPDGDSLFYTLATAPVGMSVSAQGLIIWTPTTAQEGNHSVSISVDDARGGLAMQNFTINVPINNNDPVIISEPILQTLLGFSYAYSVIANDQDNDVLNYVLAQAPAGMTIDAATGEIAWTPVSGQDGDHIVSILVADGRGGNAQQTYTLTVVIPNNNPVIISSPGLIAAVNNTYIYNVVAEDSDGDTLTYSLINSPSGMTIDSASGLVAWTPNNQQIGSYDVGVFVADGRGGSDSQTFSVSIGNTPPTINSIPVFNTRADQAYSYQVISSDLENHAISYSLDQAPAGMSVSLVTGLVTWSPQLADVGIHTVNVKVVDSFGLSDSQEFEIGVLAQSNRAPQITTTPVSNVDEGEIYSYDVDATDPDEDHLSYALIQAPAGMSISIFTGEIIWQMDAPDQLGNHAVTVRVQDIHGAYTTQNFLVNAVGRDNQPPLIISTPIISGSVGQLYTYDVEATDADNDELTYSFVNIQPDLIIDPQSGLISGIPTQAGSENITVNVTDKRDSVQQVYTLIVSEIAGNHAPQFTSRPITVVNENSLYAYPSTAIDADGDPLGFEVGVSPGNLTLNSTTGFSSWIADPIYVQSVDEQNTQCQISDIPDREDFNPVLKWQWNGGSVYAIPLVSPLIDFNPDGLVDSNDDPVVVITSFTGFVDGSTATLRVLNGKTGNQIFEVSDPALQTEGSTHPAIGDINGDGVPEIAMYLRSGGTAVLNNDGTLLWQSPFPTRLPICCNYGSVNIADLDGDGQAEILTRTHVFSSEGEILWSTQSASMHMATGLAVDLDLDGLLEVIIGNRAYRHDGTPYWEDLAASTSHSAVGNFDQDDFPEIVLTGNGTIRLLEHDGTLIWSIPVPGIGHGGAPVIADMNGDGLAEIGVAGNLEYSVINHDGSILWSAETRDGSATTGSTAFDFDGDGKPEIIYGDEVSIKIYDGTTGNIVFTLPHSSATTAEYPVVADVDNDNHAELLIVSDAGNGLRVFEDENDKWVNTRGIWNQYYYHIDNINNDASVPEAPVKSWLTHNTFRLNAFPDGNSFGLSDLRVGDITLQRKTYSYYGTDARDSEIVLLAYDDETNYKYRSLDTNRVEEGTLQKNETVSLRNDIDSSIHYVIETNKPLSARQLSTVRNRRATFGNDYLLDNTGLNSIGTEFTFIPHLGSDGGYVVFAVDPGLVQLFDRNEILIGEMSMTSRGDIWELNSVLQNNSVNYIRSTGNIILHEYSYNAFAVAPPLENKNCLGVECINSSGTEFFVSTFDYTTGAVAVFNAGNSEATFNLTSLTNGAEILTEVSVPSGESYFEIELGRDFYKVDVVAGELIVLAGDTELGLQIADLGDDVAVNLGVGGQKFLVNTQTDGATIFAGIENTQITINDGEQTTLARHEFIDLPPNQTYSIVSDKPVQVFQKGGNCCNEFNDYGTSLYPFVNVTPSHDIRAGDIVLDGGANELSAVVRNVGLTSTGGTTEVEFFNGDPDQGGTLLGATSLSSLAILGQTNVTIQVQPGAVTEDVFVRVNHLQTIEECALDNNLTRAALISLNVQDPQGLSDTQIYLLNVHNVNEAPAFTATPPPVDVITGNSFVLSVSASDADLGDNVSYSVISAPAGLTIDERTGLVTWDPNIGQGGEHTVTIVATDLGGLTSTIDLSINVIENLAPTIITLPISEVLFNGGLGGSTPIDLSTWTSEIISRNRGSVIPTWNLLDANTLRQTGNSYASAYLSDFVFSNSQITGTLQVATTADDDYIGFVFGYQNTFQHYLLSWKRGAQEMLPRGVLLTKYDLATDGSEGDPEYFNDPGFNGEILYQNENVIWLPNVEYTYTLTFLQGNISIVIREGDVVLESFTVSDSTFTDGSFGFFNVSQTDVIYSADEVNTVENAQYIYDVDATDPESQPLIFSLLEHPEGMLIDPLSGLIDWQPSLLNIGGHPVGVRVEDSLGAADEQHFTLAVINETPVITSEPLTQGFVDRVYAYDVNATDPNPNAILSYSLLESPVGMTINSSTGLVEWQPLIGDIGDHAINVEVIDDLSFSDTQSFILSVIDLPPNTAPVFSTAPSLTVTAGSSFSYVPEASDLDNDVVQISIVKAPFGLDMFDGFTVSWRPSEAQVGQHEVILVADDGKFGLTQQRFIIDVVSNNGPQNNPPTISSSPAFTGKVNQNYNYSVLASDPDGDTFNFSLSQFPSGMSIDNVSGLIHWLPVQADIGNYIVVINVDDGRGGSAQQSFNLNIAANSAPTINSVPPLNATPGLAYGYAVNAFDPDGDALTYALAQAPQGMNIDLNGLVTWLPTVGQAGLQTVAIDITDAEGLSANQTFSILVASPAGPNEGPRLSGNLPSSAQVGALYQATIPASDPNGDSLNFNLVSGPVGLNLDGAGVITWTPTTDQIGNQALVIQIDDGQLILTLTANVTVNANALPLDLTVTVFPQTVQVGEFVNIVVSPNGGTGSLSFTATVNGNPITLVNGQAQISRSDSGRYDVVASVSDAATGEVVAAETFFSVAQAGDNSPPQVSLETPIDGETITSPLDIIGTVQDANLANYILALQRKGGTQAIIIAEGSNEVISENIGVLDPTIQLNGQYDLILQATDTSGQTSFASVTINIDGDLKVGNFSFSVLDLEIPLAGIPIQITRTYDSRRRAENLDFGHGWTIDYQNVRVEESRKPGLFWSLNTYHYGPFNAFTNFCVEPQGAPVITITLPDGDQEVFEAKATPNCTQFAAILDVTLEFEAVGGDTQSTLEIIGDSNARLVNGNLVETSTFNPINPDRYRLTTRAGYVYDLDQNFGINTITTPNNHTITYTDNGVFHSAGKSVLFNRDSEGKITSITDPMGNVLNYVYNSNNDLVAATDQVDASTNYTYNRNHGLLDIIDPLGRTVVKNIYDDSGRLVAQEDGDGNRTSFNHDIAGRFSLVTDRNGNNTQFFYDDNGNVLTQIDALNNSTTYTHDERDNQLTQIDALGNQTSATFNNNNDQLTQTDALGNTTKFTYNQRGQETVITDTLGNTFNNNYDGVGNLLSITDPDGNIAGNNINAQGLVSNTVDLLGNSTVFTYDSEGNKLTETDAETNLTTFSYDENNNVLTETRTRTLPDGSTSSETTSYEYDSRNRVIATLDSLGNRYTTEFNLAGQESAQLDALGRRTEMDYDVYGRLIEMRYPDGSKENSSYDPEGNLLSQTDRNGATMTYEYDALNRQVAIIAADGARSETVYDEIGRVVASMDPLNNRSEFEYDAASRRTLTRDALGNEHNFEYDAEGNLTAEVDALNHRTEYVYNNLDQRIQTLYHDGTTMLESFDALGRRTSQTDQAGVTTTYEYDKLGRLTKVIDVQLNETSYSYDEAGNKLTQTDAEGRTTTWEYDALGRVSKRILPLGQEESFGYDANGNMTDHIDFKGELSQHTYDVLNRLVQSDFADGSSEIFQYDNNGNRVQALQTDLSGFIRTTQFSFDSLNRLQSETKANAGRLGGTQLTYTYDPAGNKTQLIVTHGDATQTITDYNYDVLNRLQSVSDGNGLTSYAYDAVGNRSSVSYGNNTSQLYIYDTLNRLTRMETYNGLGTLVQSFDYTLHATGRRTQIDELGGRNTSYSYDNLYRLVSEDVLDPNNGAYAASYQYDKVGNRLFETVNGVQTAYSYDFNDRLLQTGGSVFTYDNQGNTLTETLDGIVTTYTYNSQQELISQSQTGQVTEFAYNADGIRNGKNDGGSNTGFIIDNNLDYAQVIREDDGTTIVSYTYGDDLVSQNREGVLSYYLYDGLGSTRALSDGAGNITDEYNYEAFGELLNQVGSTENDYLFAGEQFDQELDQYYLRARYYDQNTGRFTQQDTYLGNNFDPVSLHKYLYANSDPGNFVDPSGNITIGGLLSGIGNAARLSLSAVRGGFSAAGRLFTGGGSNASKAGAAVLAANMGVKFFRSILKICKGKPNRLCQYAKGYVQAYSTREAYVRATPNIRLEGPNRVIVVSAAFDVKKGVGTAAFNGDFNARSISNSIVSKIERHGFILGVKFSCLETGRVRTTGRCAEVKAANNLIKRKKSALKNIRWLPARFVDPGDNGFAQLGSRVKACPACQALGAP